MIWLSIIYGSLLIISIYMIRLTSSQKIDLEIRTTKPVSFIIPYKNEVKRIESIIDSLNSADWHADIEIIFIDDHSTDESTSILLSDLDIPFRILKLRDNFGKKQAIAYGVMHASHQQIHTLDADIAFRKDFLLNICKLPNADLTILPVQLIANSLFQNLNSLEFQWLQTFTFAFAQLKKPVLCNGANLSFNKRAFINSLATRVDFNIPSGDDIYLLDAIQKNGGQINAYHFAKLSVETEAPSNFKNLISQRKRWIKKTISLPVLVLLLIYILYHALPFYALLHVSLHLMCLVPIVFKILAEWILSQKLSIRQFLIVVLHQLYYPIYGIALLISLPFKGRWK